MKTRIVCMPPGQLAAGMIIAAPVNGPQGSVLLAAGAELDDHSLEQLRRRGISFVCVSLADSRDESTIAREVAEAAARVGYIFRGEGSTSRQALHETLLNYRRKQAE